MKILKKVLKELRDIQEGKVVKTKTKEKENVTRISAKPVKRRKK